MLTRTPNELPSWQPRPYQWAAWDAWTAGIKRLLLVWHRRSGKDDLALHLTAVAAHQRVANYWHCLPEYTHARRAIWEAINPHSGLRRIDEAFPKWSRKSTNETTMTITFNNGSIWKLVGSDDPDSLVGAPPAGIVFSEWAVSNPSAWGYLAPILAENGGWAIFITTPRGRNHVHTMWQGVRDDPDWFCERLAVNETNFPLELIEKQRKEYHAIFGQDAGDALIEQEYYCSFEAAILGAVWGREMADAEKQGRLCSVQLDPTIPIHTAWDLGKSQNMAIWVFQVTAERIHVIDFLKGFGLGFPSFVAELERRGYKGGDDWVPHDAKVTELGTEKSRVETLIALGRKPRLVPNLGIADGINAARLALPRCYFDETACKEGLEALRQYRAEWDDKKKAFTDTQVKDWASHPADAFRYMSVAWQMIKGDVEPQDPVEKWRWHEAKLAKQLSKKQTLDEMLEQYDQEQAMRDY
jgi:phage terminase large subunit